MKSKSILIAGLLCMVMNISMAQEKQIVIMSDVDYGTQSWFYSGVSNGLQKDKIRNKYDEGYYITSVAYTSNGWFVVMSKDAGFTSQSYYYTETWPSEWISEKEEAGYYITSFSHGNGKYMFVVSKGTGYTAQTWKWDTWDNVKDFIGIYWDRGYHITQAEYINGKWLVMMHANTPYSYQGWAMRSSYDDAKEKISQIWKEKRRLQFIEYGGGSYFFVYSTLKSGKVPAQSYSTKESDIKEYISEKWGEGLSITYVGGGYQSQSTTDSGYTIEKSKEKSYNKNSNGKTVVMDATIPFMNGTTRYILYSDGSGYSENNFPCTNLHCVKGHCTMCNGTGIAIHPMLGTSMPCTICNYGKCRYCNGQGRITNSKHWAPGEAQAYNDAVRQLKNAGHDVPERDSHKSGVCPDCNGHGYRPQAYTYAAESSFAPYHNYSGNQCPICGQYTDHYHYRCTTCKRK